MCACTLHAVDFIWHYDYGNMLMHRRIWMPINELFFLLVLVLCIAPTSAFNVLSLG